jgi:hypothetical protein
MLYTHHFYGKKNGLFVFVTTIFVVVSGRSTVTQAASWHPEPRGPGSQLRWPTTRVLRWDVSAWTLRDRCEGHSRATHSMYMHGVTMYDIVT